METGTYRSAEQVGYGRPLPFKGLGVPGRYLAGAAQGAPGDQLEVPSLGGAEP